RGRSGCGRNRSSGWATSPWPAVCSASSFTTCASDRKPSRKTKRFHGKESSHEPGRTIMRDESHLLPNGRVLRYTFRERLMHWLAGLSYLYLLISGLAFWSPWLSWLSALTGGPTVSRILHPWFGVIFTVAVLWMDRIWGSQMRSTPRDREWWRSVKHYIRNEDDQVPPEDRFNAGQK